MKEIDWSKAPGDAIGAFSQGESQTFFVKTKEPSDYMNRPGYKGFQCDGNVYHVFTEFWAWSERPWAGEGLPPVGAMVEIRLMGWSIRESAEKFIGIPLRVAASFRMDCGTDMIAVDGGHDLGCEVFRAEMAVPARTPEQIAAEEREKAIDTILDDLSLSPECRYIAKRVYESGYRKVTP